MIQNVVNYITHCPQKPWLILGKGPSLDYICRHDLAAYNTFSLNHACMVGHRPTIAHFTDWEAYVECSEFLANNNVATCLPWYPHVDMRPGKLPLFAYCAAKGAPFVGKYPFVRWLMAKDLLLTYNSSLAHNLPRNPRVPVIRVRYFSAVAAFNILAAAGVKEIFTLGVDGGTGYAEGLDSKHKLANGRNSFDVQFQEIKKTCRKYNIRHVKLGD